MISKAPSQTISPITISPTAYKTAWNLASWLIIPILAWIAIIFIIEQANFVIRAPEARVAVEASVAMASLFGALVIGQFPSDKGGLRLRWVSAGFVITGITALAFGVLSPLLFITPDPNTIIYIWLISRVLSGTLFVIGLVPTTPPQLSLRSLAAIFAAISVLIVGVVMAKDGMPPLIKSLDTEAIASSNTFLSSLTGLYWGLSILPLGLAIAAMLGAARHSKSGALGRWLALAMVLLAGSQLHSNFWPSVFSPLLTPVDLIRIAFAILVAIGGIVELRRIAVEWAAMLSLERENTKRLEEINVLKADFTAMVAHELSSPLAAIRGYAAMISTGELNAEQQRQTAAEIESEGKLLNTLVADVQTAAAVERDDFAVLPKPIPVNTLLNEAAKFAHFLPGEHPVTISANGEIVLADPNRIGQVLRNLLSNAAKFSPPASPIELRSIPHLNRVCIEVVDKGNGIHPDDMARIFEKFGRGREIGGRPAAGAGLGLYLSRRIVRAHNSDLTMQSTVGRGSVFAFELEVAR